MSAGHRRAVTIKYNPTFLKAATVLVTSTILIAEKAIHPHTESDSMTTESQHSSGLMLLLVAAHVCAVCGIGMLQVATEIASPWNLRLAALLFCCLQIRRSVHPQFTLSQWIVQCKQRWKLRQKRSANLYIGRQHAGTTNTTTCPTSSYSGKSATFCVPSFWVAT